MGEVVGRKKKAVVAGALALTLGAGLGLGAAVWGSEGSVPEGGVQSGDVWGPLVGKKLEEKAGALARSHRAEVQRALAAYRASEAVEREAATEAGEQTPAEAAGAQDAHLSAEGPGASSGEAAGVRKRRIGRTSSAAARRRRRGPEVRRKAGDSPLSRVHLGPSPRKGHRQKAALLLPGRCHPTRVRALPTRSPPARWWWAVPPFPTAMCAAARRRVPEAAFGWGRMRWTTAAGAISSGTIPARSRRCAPWRAASSWKRGRWS